MSPLSTLVATVDCAIATTAASATVRSATTTTRRDGRPSVRQRVACRRIPSIDHTERFAGLPRRTLPGDVTVVEARTGKARRRGLSHLDSLPDDQALRIRTVSVHTFGMRFALDLIWLDKQAPCSASTAACHQGAARLLRARWVVETLAGRADTFLSAGVGTPASDEVERDRGA